MVLFGASFPGLEVKFILLYQWNIQKICNTVTETIQLWIQSIKSQSLNKKINNNYNQFNIIFIMINTNMDTTTMLIHTYQQKLSFGDRSIKYNCVESL